MGYFQTSSLFLWGLEINRSLIISIRMVYTYLLMHAFYPISISELANNMLQILVISMN